ncbi:leucyl-tRNA synthetase [Formosa agariphila KMM 3901]|uniref:Leucine--tRNA ligase n=1 Tax=Formosa agariphila (strain DSM 15362 / KCTC 12365 / LMG 23005 / KMM 3901 / M-2Alg 35-1) TaxID=1347342 RepID=T2KQ10_FORAG|nr:leucine--tRNA ligase [Formosa agariphila]CDF80917.1 leucyl-tRNA synthetase [Formosa agariphila KMM 3901]
MQYHFNDIEAKWQKYWAEHKTFEAKNQSEKPKYYILDMFPYPSGAGLHVGHPLGYIASDIYARYKRHKGFNVLHPQGYDSFGLPAEQYAIQTGQHPAITTETNIATYRRQLDQIGFSFDWSREVRTSNPEYYKWTQWIFVQLFNSWFNNDTAKAEDISTLEAVFSKEGNASVNAVCDDNIVPFTAEEWNGFSSEQKQAVLLQYRLTYLAETEVNWCPELGTVLANDEIVNGVSERGGYPVIRKKMTQWSMRISAYAERLLQGLNDIDWTDSLKESQRNWIGKSVGASVTFPILSFPKGEETAGSDKRAGYMTGGNNSHLLLERAKEMRANPTQAEAALWESLRGKKIEHKFRQQHLIEDFIVDFVCLDKRLIIEVDGEIHNSQLEADTERTLVLESKGFKVLRFKNEEVLGNIESVLEVVSKELAQRASVKSEQATPSGAGGIEVFTTRPDTIFGVSFMTLAPEHELVSKITTDAQKADVEAYIEKTAKRSERERMADVKTISGVFTGAYAEHPFTKEPIAIWIGDYVLASYGTGAVMAVPCGDQRDYDFAKHFDIAIPNIFEGVDVSEEAFAEKGNTKLTNSDFLNGLSYKEATSKAIEALEAIGQGEGKTNYRLRDAVFSRQRYWGEPFPVYYVNGKPQMIATEHLPIRLPEVEKYLPTETGEPPLGRADVWAWCTETHTVVSNEKINHTTVFPLELNTMPGWAGSSWYFFRYMEEASKRGDVFASEDALNYWESVDLYIGGSEHATGHLLYSRFWVKFLKDRGFVNIEEPFKKLINQGMILGTSAFVYREEGTNTYLSHGLIEGKKVTPIHVKVQYVNASDELDIEGLKTDGEFGEDFKDAEFVLEDGIFKVGREVEKMSKSKYNVVNPDQICAEYGADSLRLYEMFLGPLEQAKPWNTAGITGVHGFLKKLWKLYVGEDAVNVTDAEPTKDNLKTLHKTIKKVQEDIENFSFNTSVSTFMIAVNEFNAQKCVSKAVLEPFLVLLSPYAPHIAEELWSKLGNSESISEAPFPEFDGSHLVESSKVYPISFNGKTRFTLELSLDLKKDEIEEIVMAHEKTQEQLQGRTPKKVIVVPGKIINIVG